MSVPRLEGTQPENSNRSSKVQQIRDEPLKGRIAQLWM